MRKAPSIARRVARSPAGTSQSQAGSANSLRREIASCASKNAKCCGKNKWLKLNTKILNARPKGFAACKTESVLAAIGHSATWPGTWPPSTANNFMCYQIKFEVELPSETTRADAQKWAQFHLGELCQMDKSPASGAAFEAVPGTVFVSEAE